MAFEYPPSNDFSLSRRSVLKHAAAVVGAGASTLLGPGTTVAAQDRGATGARKFRAFVRHAAGASVEELTLRPIQPGQVLIRTQAAQTCYTIVNVLAASATADAASVQATIQGHGGVGIVEEVGSEVKRVQVGDRVIVPVTRQCGQCWLCLHGRADACAAAADRPNLPVADMANGSPVFGTLGGFSELMIAWEEQTIPISTSLPAAELSLLSCVTTTGLGLAMRRAPIEPGADVVVLGAGPVGLSALQGARIQGAGQIIVVEPVRYRRELALKVGATSVIDPNVDRDQDLISKIRNMCKLPIDRAFAGGRGSNLNTWGPMFVIEAVGGDRFPPKVEVGPDPTGIQPLQLAWTLCPPGGIIRTCGVGHPMGATVSFPAGQWSNATKTHYPGNFAGVNTMRDIPAFVRLIEVKHFDAKSLVGATFPLDRVREALQAAADRTLISTVVVFDS